MNIVKTILNRLTIHAQIDRIDTLKSDLEIKMIILMLLISIMKDPTQSDTIREILNLYLFDSGQNRAEWKHIYNS